MLKFIIIFLTMLHSQRVALDMFNVMVDELSGIDCNDCLEKNEIKPCRTIQFAYSGLLNFTNSSDIHIIIIGLYHLNETLLIDTFSDRVHNLTISGYNSSQIIAGHRNVSIIIGSNTAFKYLRYIITFQSLLFTGFGYHVPAAVVIWSTTVNMQNCKFPDNECAAINALDSSVNIYDSVFYNNTGNALIKGDISANQSASFPSGPNSAGGALALIFQNTSYLNLNLKNNMFKSNRAIDKSGRCLIQRQSSSLAFSDTGGGLLLAFIGTSSYITVDINNNTFNGNHASLGGGIMFSFYGKSGYNQITVAHTLITKNLGSITGGGFAFGTWSKSSFNHLSIINSSIAYNGARVGGGGKILLQSQTIYSSDATPAVQYITFTNVSFHANKAASASGLHLIYNLAVGLKSAVPIIFQNITFSHHCNNADFVDAQQGPSAYSGVLLSNRVDMQFERDNYFKNNTLETPLYLSNTELYLVGNLTFLHNRVQTSGGGMTLTDVSHLFLASHSNLLFQENFARVQGGAMFIKSVGFPDMVYKYNPSCFIQYYDNKMVPPSKWNVSVKFVKNAAGLKGAAIFANTITPCIWVEHPPYFNFNEALRWNGKFKYRGNYLTRQKTYTDASTDIATDTIRFDIHVNGRVKRKENLVAAAPGESIKFEIHAFDELKNPVYSVPVASISNTDNSDVGNKMVLKDQYYIVEPNVSKSQSLQFLMSSSFYDNMTSGKEKHIVHFVDSYSSFLSNAVITINPVKCLPGFSFKDRSCVCNDKVENVVRCGDEIVYINKGFWGKVNRHGELITKKCPRNYCNCHENKTLLGCAFNYRNPDLQCATGRTGTLCGKCKPGYGLTLMSSDCVTCDGFSWSILYLAIIATAVIIAAVLVLVLNPRFSSHFRGIIFFVQMLPYVCDPSGKVNKIILAISSWVDLGGVNGIPINSCFLEQFTSLNAITLGYLYPALIYLVLLTLYILHKFHMVNFRRNTPFQSFWILMVAIYKFLVETSLLLLFCVPLDGSYVFYFDGNVQCYKNVHLVMTIVASAVLLLVVVPLPIVVLLIVFGVLPVGPVITDALAQGLRKHVRWWWAVDFIRRIVFIAVYVFTPDWQMKQTTLIVCCVLTLVFHMQMHPYRNKMANMGESFLLLCLTLLVTIVATPKGNETQDYILAAVAISATTYCILITLYLWIMFFVKVCRTRAYYQLEEKDEDTDDEEVYNESPVRRLATPHEKLKFPNSPIERMIKERGKYNSKRVVPSPTYTRSDFKDS